MDSKCFDWKTWLDRPNFQAASVALMKHVPGHELFKGVVFTGMKVVVEHTEIPSLPNVNGNRRRTYRKAYWPVMVLKISGYYFLVRYEGSKESSHDFWIHAGSVYPVGGEPPNCVMIPPACIYGDESDWRTYLLRRMQGAVTLPSDFQDTLWYSVNKCKYRIGDYVEVIDKYKISQLRIALVKKIFGRRMYLQYIDDDSDGFYCHEQSSLIHNLGWGAYVGHKVQVPLDIELPTSLYNYNYDSTSITYENPMTQKTSFQFSGMSYHEGMKLEAVDPLCPSKICGATISKVLEDGYMMIKIDCYDHCNPNAVDNPGFCYHISSPYIFKCGFCKEQGIPLVPPTGHNYGGDFNWEEYLASNELLAAPIPEQLKLDHGFQLSMKLEMADVMTPMKVHTATVIHIAGRLLRINFDGWGPDFDQWMDAESPDIYPVGWCSLVGYCLETTTRRAKKH